MINAVKSFFKKYPHTYTLIVFVLLLIWFRIIELTITVPKYVMHIGIDDKIPFLSVFVLPYLSWFIYIACAMAYLLIKDKSEFLRLSSFIYIGMALSYIFFMLFPNGQDLRPTVLGNNIFDRLVAFVYSKDSPVNSVPSIHVIDAIAVHIALYRYNGFRHNILVKTLSFVLCALICLSTMFIKQHSVVDVVAGLAVSAVLYVAVYKINPVVVSNSINEEKAS